jgi:hypothetical protein
MGGQAERVALIRLEPAQEPALGPCLDVDEVDAEIEVEQRRPERTVVVAGLFNTSTCSRGG